MNKGKIFLTQYWIGSEFFASEIIANNKANAIASIKERSIGEVIIGTSGEIKQVEVSTIEELLHYCCFVSFIALKSKKATVEQILGDRGVLHELIHILSGISDDKTTKDIVKKIDWLFELTSVPVPLGISGAVGLIDVPLSR